MYKYMTLETFEITIHGALYEDKRQNHIVGG